MANTPLRIVAKVTQGLLSPQARQAILSYLKGHEGKNVVIEVKRYHKKQSIPWLNYWNWATAYITSQLIARGEQATHEGVKTDFKVLAGWVIARVTIHGEIVTEPRTIRDAQPADMDRIMELARQYCMENWGFEVPFQNEMINELNEVL